MIMALLKGVDFVPKECKQAPKDKTLGNHVLPCTASVGNWKHHLTHAGVAEC